MTKTIRDFHRYIILSIALVLLSSCASVDNPVRMYTGDKRPDVEIAKLLVPSALEVLSIDGKKLKTPYVPGGLYEVEVLPGTHVLTVVYAELWGDSTTSEHVTSDAFHFKLITRAGSRYEFKHNGPYDLVAADFTQISEIKIWLEHLDTGQIVNAENVTTYGSAISRAIMPSTAGQGVSTNTQVSSAQQTPSDTVQASQASAQNVTSTLTAEQIISKQDALERLKYWWQRADKNQHEVFISRTVVSGMEQVESAADVDALNSLNFWWKLANEKQREDFKAWIETQKSP